MTGAIFMKIKIVILPFLTLGAMAIIKKIVFLVLDYPLPLNLFLITFWLLNLITQSSLALPTSFEGLMHRMAVFTLCAQSVELAALLRLPSQRSLALAAHPLGAEGLCKVVHQASSLPWPGSLG